MSSTDSYDDEKSPDSEPAFSREAHTPRGGFMARPGLKAPPRHAVVVRVGDVPESEHIPLARSSVPPPPPASVEPAPDSASEQVTLRTLARPGTREARGAGTSRTNVHVGTKANTSANVRTDSSIGVAVMESSPPPSDAPLVAHVNGPESAAPRSRRAGSRWTIVAAAAAGLILGLASVAMKVRALHNAAEPTELTSITTPVEQPRATGAATTLAGPLASSPAAPTPSVDQRVATPAAAGSNRQNVTGAKRSIF